MLLRHHHRSTIGSLALTFAFTFACACTPTTAHDATWVTSEITNRHRASVPPSMQQQQPIDLTKITEDEAVSIALWNSAQFHADLAQLGFSRADLIDAGALPNPTLSFLFPVSTRQLELSLTYPIAATNALLQRPWRVAAAKLDLERVARGLVQSGLDFIRDVRIAWAELQATRHRRVLRLRIDEIVKASSEIASSRHRTGDVSALEADLVRAESLAATELAQRSVHEETIARDRLRMLLGLADSALVSVVTTTDAAPEAPSLTLSASSSLPIFGSSPPLPQLESTALGARPDLRASEIAVESAGERGGLEKARIVQLFARLDAKPVGTRGGPPLLWLPGFTAEIPIFNQNQAGRARAKAEIERASWLYLTTKHQVLTDVRLAHEELVMARTSLEPWQTTIVPLQEKNVATAMKAYEGGAESYLVVIDATRRLVDARLRTLDLELDVYRARARLDRAVGWKIEVGTAAHDAH